MKFVSQGAEQKSKEGKKRAACFVHVFFWENGTSRCEKFLLSVRHLRRNCKLQLQCFPIIFFKLILTSKCPFGSACTSGHLKQILDPKMSFSHFALCGGIFSNLWIFRQMFYHIFLHCFLVLWETTSENWRNTWGKILQNLLFLLSFFFLFFALITLHLCFLNSITMLNK